MQKRKVKRNWRPAAKLGINEVVAIDAIGKARGTLNVVRVYERYRLHAKLATVMHTRYAEWKSRNCSGAEPRRDSTYTVGMVFNVSPRTISDIWNHRSWR